MNMNEAIDPTWCFLFVLIILAAGFVFKVYNEIPLERDKVANKHELDLWDKKKEEIKLENLQNENERLKKELEKRSEKETERLRNEIEKLEKEKKLIQLELDTYKKLFKEVAEIKLPTEKNKKQ